jgi:PST family polysaccharide transporter
MAAAMSKTGAASIASGLLGALGTKIIATMLGPGSLAVLATLQQLRDGAVTVATVNGRTAVVQGASSLEGVERREYVRTSVMLFAGGTFLTVAALLAAPQTLARWSRLPAPGPALLAGLGAPVLLLSIFAFLTAILNALREIGKLALLQLASPLAAAVIAWPLASRARAGHPGALVVYLAIPAGATVAAALLALRRHREELQSWFLGPGRWWSPAAARGFVSLSGAMLGTGLAASGVLLAVRASIARHEGLAMTGQFDAAWNISMSQVTLILGSVQTFYLPTLAGAQSAERRALQIRSMLLVATLATIPAIVALVTLKTLAVGVLYSPLFSASPSFLRWTLLGDYLKVGAWVLATPMLATRDVGIFVTTDLAAQAIFFAAAMLFSRVLRPAEGAAFAFLVSYGAYFALCYWYARARHGFRFGASGWVAWLGGLALILGASASSWSDTGVHGARSSLWILLALGFSGGFALYLRRRES